MSSAPAESTIAIPTLVEEAKNGRLALLIGADLDRELTGVPSARDLALGLSPEVASLVEAARGKARWRPVSHLCNAMDSASESVGPLHAAAARLRLWSYATAAYDGGLQRALKTDHVEPNLLIEDSDLIERHSGRPDLFKLCGDMQRLHSLVISEADYRHQDDRKDLLKMLRGWLKEKTVLLIGCDPAPESDFARHLYGYIAKKPDGFGGGAFLVWPGPSESLVAWWQQYNVTLVDAEPLAFLETLADELAGVNIPPPDDGSGALFKILSERPAQLDALAALEKMPPKERPRSIQATFRLWLSGSKDPRLHALFDVDYQPSVMHYHDVPRNTGIALSQLQAWAANAATAHRHGRSPEDGPDGPVQHDALAFFDALLPPNSNPREDGYEMALTLSQLLNARLSIVFELLDEKGRLAAIPWELLHDGHADTSASARLVRGFLGLTYATYRLPASVVSVEQMTGRIQKALVVGAGKIDGLAAEVGWLMETLQDAGVAVDTLVNQAGPAEVKAQLRQGHYQLFHFIGHGQFDAADPARSKLLLGLPREQKKVLTAADLAQEGRASGLILAFLSACEGAEEAQAPSQPWKEAGIVDGLVRAGVPATVGMRWEVGAENNHVCARQFYRSLLVERVPVEDALMIARRELRSQLAPDWATPVLTKRHGVL